jgi:chromosome partitioning protein
MDGSKESYMRQAPQNAEARGCDVVIIDCPQIEDHPKITGLAMQLADELVIPAAPTPIEIERTTPMLAKIDAADAVRLVPLRSAILLTRTVANANSTADAREVLRSLGFDILATSVPRLEIYAQSFGGPIGDLGAGIWRLVAGELAHRAQIEEVTHGDYFTH